MIKLNENWDTIEKTVNKLRKLDYKEFIKSSIQCYKYNPKKFHKLL